MKLNSLALTVVTRGGKTLSILANDVYIYPLDKTDTVEIIPDLQHAKISWFSAGLTKDTYVQWPA